MLAGIAAFEKADLAGSLWEGEPPANRSGGGGGGINVTNVEPFLFVGVLSVPHSYERRRAARETWMATASNEVAVRFVLYKVGAGLRAYGE